MCKQPYSLYTCKSVYLGKLQSSYPYTHIHTYMYTCMYTRIHKRMHTRAHTCIHVCIHTQIHTHTYNRVYFWRLGGWCSYAHIRIQVHTHIRIQIHTYIRIQIHPHIHPHIQHVSTRNFTHLYTHTHTHTHTYIRNRVYYGKLREAYFNTQIPKLISLYIYIYTYTHTCTHTYTTGCTWGDSVKWGTTMSRGDRFITVCVFLSHMWMHRVARMIVFGYICEWVMSVTYVNESCHT